MAAQPAQTSWNMEYERRRRCARACVHVAAQPSHVSCYLLSWRSQGVLLASQGGPDWADIWRTGRRWPVGLFSAAAVTATVRLSSAPLSLSLSGPFVSQDLVSGCHTFLLLSLSFMFFSSCPLHSSRSISVSFSLSVPFCSTRFFSPSISFFFPLTHQHSACLPHTYSLSYFSLLPLGRWGHCAGQTALRNPPATALKCWEAGRGEGARAQDLYTNKADPPLGFTEGQREQPEVKCCRRTYSVATLQGDSYVAGKLISFSTFFVLIGVQFFSLSRLTDGTG